MSVRAGASRWAALTLGPPFQTVDVSHNWPSSPEYYNSVIAVNGNGETIANYRKSFLYYTDETWALEGKGFFEGNLGNLGQVAMGICMDINPYKFQTPWNKFEFAFHVLEVKANLVILSMAWLTQEDPTTFTQTTDDPDMETLSYWIQRLEPIIRMESEEEIIVVFCNRCGREDDVTYAGSSAVLGIQNGEVSVYGLMGRGVKDLMIVDTNEPAFGKLVNRPDEQDESKRHSRLLEEFPTQIGADSPRSKSSGSIRSGTSSNLPPSPSAAALPSSLEEVREDEPASEPDEYPMFPGEPPVILPSPAPVVYPSPAPECEQLNQSETEGEEDYESSCVSETGSVSGAETETEAETIPIHPQSVMRPKLEISTALDHLSPRIRKPPTPTVQSDSIFTSQDLPIQPDRYTRSPLHAKPPPYPAPRSALADVPEETNWSPPASGSAMTSFAPWDVDSALLRTPLSRASNRSRPLLSPIDAAPLSPRSAQSNFSRPLRAADSLASPKPQFDTLPDNLIPIMASPSVFQTTFPHSASSYQEHFTSLDGAANEDLGGEPWPENFGRSKSVSSLSQLSHSTNQDAAPHVPEFPRSPAPAAEGRDRASKRTAGRTQPLLSAAIQKLSPVQPHFNQDDAGHMRAPFRPSSRGRPQGGKQQLMTDQRQRSVSPKRCPLPASPLELRSPVYT